jgi:hypothetical protein
MTHLFNIQVQQVFPDDRELQAQVKQAAKSYSHGESLVLSSKGSWETFKGKFGAASGGFVS